MAITNFAQEVFRSNSDQLLVPRQKFNFTIIFDQINDSSIAFHRVQNVTVPSYSFDTMIANQYNKKRVVQTRMNYDPITVTFYDTFDNQFQTLMRQYIGHYYNGSNGIENRTSTEGTGTVSANFVTDAGYTPVTDRYFFPTIQIIQNGYRNKHRKTVLINPTITQVQGDTLSYDDSSPVTYSVTFQPESIQTEEIERQFDDTI